MNTPLVTVCIPTHNRLALLKEAIQSVLAQTMQDFELLIVDDGSDDETKDSISDLQSLDPRIRCFRNDQSGGPSAAKNIGLREARGIYWTGLDDDDLFLPDRLSQFTDKPLADQSFYCSGFFIERNRRRHRLNTSSKIITFDQLCHFNSVGNQVFAKVTHLRELGGFDENLRTFEDYDLWIRLAKKFGAGFRFGNATYVQRQGYASSSLTFSPHFCSGAKAFSRKHHGLFSGTHLRSQRLVHAIACNQPLSVKLALESVTIGNLPLWIRFCLAHNRYAKWMHEQLRKKNRS